MNNMYDNNLEALINSISAVTDIIMNLNKTELDCERVFLENGVIYYNYNDRSICLNSIYTENEIELYTKKIEFTKDNLILVFGLANIDLLNYIYTKMTKETKVIVFEPDLQVAKFSFINFDYTKLILSDSFIFFVGESNQFERVFKLRIDLRWDNYVYNIQVIANPNYYIYKDYMLECVKIITAEFDASIKSLGNSLEDMFEGFRNNYLNIDSEFSSNCIDDIAGKFKGYPAIIVASGPSLDKNIKYLKDAQDKALIISCDASYTACKQNGVKPDAIASIERIEETYKYYYQDKKFDDDLVLIGPTLLWPKTVEEFKGKKILTSKINQGGDNWWQKFFDNIKHVGQGMSCANVAFAYATIAGCNPIILIGQDLAFTDEKIHSDSTHTKYEGDNVCCDKYDIWVEDVHGNKVRTNDIYNMFRYWFEVQIQTNEDLYVVDATEGGALINGSHVMTLRNSIDKFCNKKLEKHMYECLSDVYISDIDKAKKCDIIIKDTRKQIRNMELIRNRTNVHYKFLNSIKRDEVLDYDEKKLIKLIVKMQKGDTLIKYINNNHEDNYEYFQQIIKQTIIHVKKIGNELTAENVLNNVDYQANLMYMISGAAEAIINEYSMLIEFIDKKKDEYLKEAE